MRGLWIRAMGAVFALSLLAAACGGDETPSGGTDG